MEVERCLAVLAGVPAKVNALVAGLSEEQLRWHPEDGEWSVKEVLCHLRDSANLYNVRMQRIATRDEPYLPAWNQEEHAKGYLAEDTALVLPALIENRLEIISFLRDLAPASWDRRGTHEETGIISLRAMLDRETLHELDHISQPPTPARRAPGARTVGIRFVLGQTMLALSYGADDARWYAVHSPLTPAPSQ